jgi:hypothetical protein
MGLFGKKPAATLDANADNEVWTLVEGEHQGSVMTVRRNKSALGYVAHPGLPVRMSVAMLFMNADGSGLPSEDEEDVLKKFETDLKTGLGSEGRVVLIITSDGRREFICYVASEAVAQRATNLLRVECMTHEIEMHTERDPKWVVFREFVK